MKWEQKKGLNNRRGQSIVEYILLIAAVIVIMLLFFGKDGFFRQHLNRTLELQGERVIETSQNIFF